MDKYMQVNQLADQIAGLCQDYRNACIEVGCREGGQVVGEISLLCGEARKQMDIRYPALLLALMDAYEVTRDEGMLQEVLDVVSEDLSGLEVSVKGVELLSCCYYYVEEEECAERAKEMLEELRKTGEEKGIAEAEHVFRELVEG